MSSKINVEFFQAVGIWEGAWILDDSYEDWKEWNNSNLGKSRNFLLVDQIYHSASNLFRDLTDRAHPDLLIRKMAGYCSYCALAGIESPNQATTICPHFLEMEGIDLVDTFVGVILKNDARFRRGG